MQGYMGQQYRPGDVQGDMNAMPTGSAGGLVEALEQDVFDFLNIIQSDGTLAGIVNVINDFQQSILKWKYLLRLCGGYPGDLIVEKPVRKGLKGMEMFVVDLG
ncbi:MAG: hypothetical protein LBE56_12370 [Tannerella sp.]|jgi:hypothetical protein|nr:hypothetical protein [Tannerella sp.]